VVFHIWLLDTVFFMEWIQSIYFTNPKSITVLLQIYYTHMMDRVLIVLKTTACPMASFSPFV
jgi:hypothetical protein